MKRAAVRIVREAPFTSLYLAVLLATTCVLVSVPARTADSLLLARSTNLHHLAHDPLRVLVASAFWLSAPWQLLPFALLFLLVLVPVERRIGSLRTAGAFAAGHVGATLLVAAGLWVGLRFDLVDRSVVDARDVGASYGLVAVAALMTYLLDRRLRLPYATALSGYLAIALAQAPTFTSFGHVLALLIGFGCRGLAAHAATSGRGTIGTAALTAVLSRARSAAPGPRPRPRPERHY
jgi:hypothetical protein